MRSTDIIFVPLLAIASAVALGCNRDADKPGEPDTKTSAGEQAKAGEQTKGAGTASQLTENGREFILSAANDGMFEVEAGKLAQNKAQTEPVKEFARMMVEHHTRTNEELATLARSMNLEVSKALDEKGQDKLDDLRDESGRDFDKEYIDLMIDEHERVIRQFEREAERDDDPQVRSWASKTLPTLRTHLDRAKAVEDTTADAPLDVTSPGAGSPSGAQPEAGAAGSPSGAAGSPSAPGAGGNETKSGDTKSGTTKSGTTKSGTTKSGDTKSGDTKTPPDASPAPGPR